MNSTIVVLQHADCGLPLLGGEQLAMYMAVWCLQGSPWCVCVGRGCTPGHVPPGHLGQRLLNQPCSHTCWGWMHIPYTSCVCHNLFQLSQVSNTLSIPLTLVLCCLAQTSF